MHIGIDARFIQGPNTGVTNYLSNLLRGLSRVDKHNTYTIFLSDASYNGRIPDAHNFHIKINTINAFFWKNFWLPRQARRLNIDVMHFPAYTGTFTNIGNNVVTVHDLIHRVNPGWFSRKELLLFDLKVKLAVKKATKIIAVSENTKQDLIKYYGIKGQNIAVTLEAADPSFRPIHAPEKLTYIRKKYAIDRDFIFFLGVLFKRRNIERLLEAFSRLKRNRNIEQKLVITGPEREYSNLTEKINKYALNKEVIYLGYVPQEDLPLLYNAALFFVYPSLYEGFGLPVLEAMSCGKAVITSNVSSLPEIIGDAGLLIDPYHTEELYETMARLLQDIPLRQDLERKALQRAKVFNWDKMARQTIAIYESAIKN